MFLVLFVAYVALMFQCPLSALFLSDFLCLCLIFMKQKQTYAYVLLQCLTLQMLLACCRQLIKNAAEKQIGTKLTVFFLLCGICPKGTLGALG